MMVSLRTETCWSSLPNFNLVLINSVSTLVRLENVEVDEKKNIIDVQENLQIVLFGHHVFFECSHFSTRKDETNKLNKTFGATDMANGN